MSKAVLIQELADINSSVVNDVNIKLTDLPENLKFYSELSNAKV